MRDPFLEAEMHSEDMARYDRFDGWDKGDEGTDFTDQHDWEPDATDEAFDDFLDDLACAESAEFDDSIPF